MAAALAYGLAVESDRRRSEGNADLDLLPAIEAGLLAMRDLNENGHDPVVDGVFPVGYPLRRITKKILEALGGELGAGKRLARIGIEWPEDSAPSTRSWSIVEASQRGRLFDLAEQVVLYGTKKLGDLPHAQFGKLVTADRAEIEALRHIRLRMRVYDNDRKPKRPLCIGVFGPPGAGKSFGVEQLAAEVFGKEAWRKFNLSQFRDSTDLNGAFHQVRDLALAGQTPVFWDEFDSRKLFWLQYLLAPMQDGRFQDGQLNHSIGKCVFVFAGGTSWSFAEFSPPQRTLPAEAHAAFQLRKGPDFVSRLDAFMDVPGPNRRLLCDEAGERKVDQNDVGYSLRRALLIRAYLGCGLAQRVDFDPGLLNAMLRVCKYKHGARSLEKLMELLRGDDALVVRRSNLPEAAQLSMHVDVLEFMKLMQGLADPNPTA